MYRVRHQHILNPKNITRISMNDITRTTFLHYVKKTSPKNEKYFSFSGSHRVKDSFISSLCSNLKRKIGLTVLHLDLKEMDQISHSSLLKLLKRIITLKNLKHLDLKVRGVQNSHIVSISRAISALRQLSNLELHFHMNPETLDRSMFILSRSLSSYNKTLTSISVLFSINLGISDRGLAYLVSPIHKFKELTKFKLMLQSVKLTPISDLFISYLSNRLPELKKLNSLILYFPASDKITDESFFTFSNALQEMESLQHLQLKFSSDEITDAAIWRIRECLPKLKNLTYLQLCFVGCELLSDYSFKSLFRSIGKMHSLKHLGLNFMDSPISNKGVKDLCYCFNNELYSFALCLRGCSNIVDQNLTFIGPLCDKEFKILNLDLSFADVNLKKLTSLISTLQYLEELQIQLANSSLKDYSNLDLCDAFSNLQSLRKLTFILDNNEDITDLTLYSFSQALPRIRSLREVIFSAAHCPKITDKGVVEFSKNIGRLRNLKALKLNIGSCKEITNDSVYYLGENLARVSGLERLDLGLDHCVLITSKAVVTLCKRLQVLKHLVSLLIRLNHCMQVRWNKIDNLEDIITMKSY